MFRQTSGKRGALLAAVTCGVGLGLVVLAGAQGPPRESQTKKDSTQTRKDRDTTQIKKEYRYAPTLAILMAAYEGLLKNDETTNPKAVRALKESFARNPSARKTIDKLHKAYRGMSAADREKVVGRELAQVTGQTRLTRAVLEPITTKHFKKTTAMKAEAAPRAVQAAQMKAVMSDDKEEKASADFKSLVEDRPAPFKERLTGREHKEGSSTTYRIDYTGLYCQRRPLDWWGSCEPAVIFTMHQGDSEWTRSFGPYDGVDAGEKRSERRWLRQQTPFNNDVTVVGTLIEHDVGSLEEIQDAVQTAVDVVVGIVDEWVDLSGAISNAIADALTWVADVLGLTHDQIGESQMMIFDRNYAATHTGHSHWEGIEYDTFFRFRGNMSGPRNQRGDFYVFMDVRRYP